MTVIESVTTNINAPAEAVYQFLFDLNNHRSLMPQAVTDWESTPEEAKLRIQGLGALHLKRSETRPGEWIKITPASKPPVELHLEWEIKPAAKGTDVKVTLFAELNMMMKMVAVKPLQNLADYMSAHVAVPA